MNETDNVYKSISILGAVIKWQCCVTRDVAVCAHAFESHIASSWQFVYRREGVCVCRKCVLYFVSKELPFHIWRNVDFVCVLIAVAVQRTRNLLSSAACLEILLTSHSDCTVHKCNCTSVLFDLLRYLLFFFFSLYTALLL